MGTNNEADQRAVDGIASTRAGAKSTEGCAARLHASGGSSHCCVEVDGVCVDNAAEAALQTSLHVLALERQLLMKALLGAMCQAAAARTVSKQKEDAPRIRSNAVP